MISYTLYIKIANLINSAQKRGAEIIEKTEDMLMVLSSSEIPSSDVYRQKIESSISVSYDKLSEMHFQKQVLMLSFVASLQKHVEDNYGDVNSFLSDNYIKVKEVFASLSETAGFSIDSSNIETES